MSYTYQWKRCDAFGASCVDVAGATGTNYVLSTPDLGSTMRVTVSDGVTTATSGPTAVITTEGPPGPTPSGYYWKGDFSAGNFDNFDMTGARFGLVTNDAYFGNNQPMWAVVAGKGPADYTASTYAARVIGAFYQANGSLMTSGSSTGQDTEAWEFYSGGVYQQPWYQKGQTVWNRARVLIPNGGPTYPGILTPLAGDGVSETWHQFVEWHKNDGASAPGQFSSHLGIGWGGYGIPGGSLMMVPTGGTAAAQSYRYFYATNQTQTQVNGIGETVGGVQRLPAGTPQPVQFNHWYDMLWKWTWGDTASTGYMEWWVDGALKVAAHIPTIWTRSDGVTPGLSFQAGLYRNYPTYTVAGITHVTSMPATNEHIWIGPMFAGPTRASVGA